MALGIPFSNGNTSLGIVGPTEYIDKLSENGDTAEALRKAIFRLLCKTFWGCRISF
jgi:hypothetical protein